MLLGQFWSCISTSELPSGRLGSKFLCKQNPMKLRTHSHFDAYLAGAPPVCGQRVDPTLNVFNTGTSFFLKRHSESLRLIILIIITHGLIR